MIKKRASFALNLMNNDIMSPERGSGGQATVSSDMYSLGCIFVAFLSISTPFPENALEKRSSIFSSDILDVVEAMVDTDPTRRPTPARLLETVYQVFSPREHTARISKAVDGVVTISMHPM
eukprot:GILJ01023120.1.p3 GENE.GILJ01023120.1~~GILJ01023120.1.p3  ORF type:complete len:121 (+),score=8.72 GILJ01023120.1:184-546(+)